MAKRDGGYVLSFKYGTPECHYQINQKFIFPYNNTKTVPSQLVWDGIQWTHVDNISGFEYNVPALDQDTINAISWDGNTEGRLFYNDGGNVSFYKVSDYLPHSPLSISYATATYYNGVTGQEGTVQLPMINRDYSFRSGMIVFSKWVLDTDDDAVYGSLVYEPQTIMGTYVTPGIYFGKGTGSRPSYVKSLELTTDYEYGENRHLPPTTPYTAGTYLLQCTVDSSGESYYSWVAKS